jgi:hypothetical protein
MSWPLDKLSVVNDALGLTGNSLSTVADDGTDEWTTASIGYEAAITYMIDQHDWKFASNIVTLQPLPTPPLDNQFTAAYAKPADCLHVVWVRLNDLPCVYEIIANQITLGPASINITGLPVTLKYISQPTPDKVTPTFMMALRSFVMSAIYRGLHEDPIQADRMWQAGEQFLQSARTRSDQEQPKRAFFNSRMTAARSIRRPWRPTPGGWGGSNGPGT